MRNELLKLCERQSLAEMIYMRADGKLSKRKVHILAVGQDSFQAYCHLRHERRLFKMDRVLSIQRVISKPLRAV